MNYPIPSNFQEIQALKDQADTSPELVATALVGVIQIARQNGQSLEEVQREVLKSDNYLDSQQRLWLSELLAMTWQRLA
ncbi:MAG: hypothetical protein AAGF24_02035 [Cyanobacteria bacterium P01_H01_bin.121]